ncbi:MAG TPA: DUF6688 family protein [Tepidisphaeraceae bacterium]|nr:DUF6688 family protein [Tepidisphaeraceae bacterium]
MSQTVLDYRTPQPPALKPRGPITPIEAVFHVFSGVLLPTGCFLISASRYPLGPEWQMPEWKAYVGLIPSAACAWPFYPFLLFSMVSIARMVWAPKVAAESIWVRLGLYSGVILAFQFSMIQAICCVESTPSPIESIFEAFGLTVLATGGIFIAGLIVRFAGWLITLTLLAAATTIAILFQVWFFFIIAPLALAPAMTMVTCLTLSYLAFKFSRENRGSNYRLLLPAGWLAGYGLAWRTSIAMVMIEYSRLPKTAPNCYIATAAAKGHPRLVGARPGYGFLINDQLCHLKCAELVLHETFPRLHRLIRRVYDVVGPGLASKIRHPLLADFAYLTLKPVEWAVMLILRRVVPDAAALAKTLYGQL